MTSLRSHRRDQRLAKPHERVSRLAVGVSNRVFRTARRNQHSRAVSNTNVEIEETLSRLFYGFAAEQKNRVPGMREPGQTTCKSPSELIPALSKSISASRKSWYTPCLWRKWSSLCCSRSRPSSQPRSLEAKLAPASLPP